MYVVQFYHTGMWIDYIGHFDTLMEAKRFIDLREVADKETNKCLPRRIIYISTSPA